MKAWLKGGILIFPISIILIIIIGLIITAVNGGECSTGVCYEIYPDYCPKSTLSCFGPAVGIVVIVESFYSYPLIWVIEKILANNHPLIYSISAMIIVSITIFITGALIGWIIGKIRPKIKSR